MRLLALVFFLLLISSAKSQTIDDIKLPLIFFLRKLGPNNPNIDRNLNWTENSDPCSDRWRGISCNNRLQSLRSIDLESLKLNGSIDGELLSILCNSSSLTTLNLNSNSLTGNLPPEISYCSQLTNLFLSNNRLSGTLPSSLPNLRNLKKLDISSNNFSGDHPSNLSDISGLDTFLADHNHFTGTIPDFDLNYFDKFNVSFNQFSGSVPLNSVNFPLSSFNGNPGLCGKPFNVSCSPPPPPSSSISESKKAQMNTAVLISGYVLFGSTLVLLLLYFLRKKKKNRLITPKREPSDRKLLSSSEKQESGSVSEYSMSSPASAAGDSSSSLIVLSKDRRRKDLRLEELLRAPAELMRKGSFGSTYKVVIHGGETELVVKRIKDSTLTREEFRKKIMRIGEATHPNVLPLTAFYCSKQEKLVVYEYQKNGSLFSFLHENRDRMAINLATRLNIAAGISGGLSYMHQTKTTAAGHGNLKSSNILFSSSMKPLISEHGLTALPISCCEMDVYALGVIFLELLTGKPSNGFDLAQWVQSVVREEWTVEVFDRSLLAGEEDENAEEAMLGLLRVALRCISPESHRPTLAEVAFMVEAIEESLLRWPKSYIRNEEDSD